MAETFQRRRRLLSRLTGVVSEPRVCTHAGWQVPNLNELQRLQSPTSKVKLLNAPRSGVIKENNMDCNPLSVVAD